MIIGIVGKMGSGKTLLMSIFAYCLKGRAKIFSNYSLIFSEKINSLRQLIKIENSVICLDELWVNIDSRLWKNNVFLTRWINQSRKRNVLLFYTTQDFGQVDIRLRRATDILIFCLSTKSEFLYFIIEPASQKLLKSFRLEKENAKKFFGIYDTFQVVYPLRF